jgi:hypothetical protein
MLFEIYPTARISPASKLSLAIEWYCLLVHFANAFRNISGSVTVGVTIYLIR